VTRFACAGLALTLIAAAAMPASGSAAPVGASTQARLHWHPGVARAENYARDRLGDVRFAVIGANGDFHGFHPGRTAPAASVFKVMLMVAYLREHSVRHRPLTDYEKGLLSPMIRRSDSVAATRVNQMVGGDRIWRLAHAAGMKHFRYNPTVWGNSLTAPADQVRFMYHLDRYLPRSHDAYARHLLAKIVPSQRWGVGQVPLRGWKLFFKGGWGSGTGRVDHQVAFLESHGYRIGLAIFTEFDPSHAYGEQTLQGVARRLLRGLPRLG
jgi:hypothetical protein